MSSILSVARIQCSGDSMLRVRQSAKKACTIFFGVFTHGVTPACGGIGDDPVVHVGQVHDVIHLEAAQFQEPSQNILETRKCGNCRCARSRRPSVRRCTSSISSDFSGTKSSTLPDRVLWTRISCMKSSGKPFAVVQQTNDCSRPLAPAAMRRAKAGWLCAGIRE